MENKNEEEVVDEVVDDKIVETQDDDGNDNTDWEALAKKNQGIAQRYKTKLEKAKEKPEEKIEEKPVEKPVEKKEDESNLSSEDLYALMEAKVPHENIEEVKQAAKVLNIPISEALETSLVKSILSEKAEFKKTANATNTGGSRKGSEKVSDNDLLTKAENGELPESAEDIERLYKIRKGII